MFRLVKEPKDLVKRTYATLYSKLIAGGTTITCPKKLERSPFLRLYFWYFASEHYKSLAVSTKKNRISAVRDFFNFLREFEDKLQDNEGSLSRDVLILYYSYLKKKKISSSYRAELMSTILCHVNAVKKYSSYRSRKEWHFEIDEILENRPKHERNKFQEEPRLSLSELAKSYLNGNSALDFETVHLKAWFLDAWRKAQKIRNSLNQLNFDKKGLLDISDLEKGSLNFLSCRGSNCFKNLTIPQKIVISRYIDAIFDSNDDFLIEAFYHSLNPSFFDDEFCFGRAFLNRNASIEEIKATKGLFYPQYPKYQKKEDREKEYISITFSKKKNGRKRGFNWNWSEPFSLLSLFIPTLSEMLLVRDLLAYHQVSPSGLDKLTLDDFKVNDNEDGIQVRSEKVRTGDGGKRIVDTPFFRKGSMEFEILATYRFMMETAYQKYGFLFKDAVTKLAFPKVYTSGNLSSYTPYDLKSLWLHRIYTYTSIRQDYGISKNARKYVMTVLPIIEENSLRGNIDYINKQIKSVEKKRSAQKLSSLGAERKVKELLRNKQELIKAHNDKWNVSLVDNNITRRSIGMTAFRQTAIAQESQYFIQQKNPHHSLNKLQVGDIDNPEKSAKHAHTAKTEQDVYVLRSRSPILMESEKLFGEQVAHAFFQDAVKVYKDLTSSTMMVTIEKLRERLGLASLSEMKDDYSLVKEVFDNSDILDFKLWDGFGVSDWLKEGSGEIVVIKHPLMAAFMKNQIRHIDQNLPAFANAEISAGSDKVDEKVSRYLAVRAHIAALLDRFDEEMHAKAEELMRTYELPPLPPL